MSKAIPPPAVKDDSCSGEPCGRRAPALSGVTIASMRNVFSACRTVRPGVTLVRAELDDFAFPVHSHDHLVVGLATAGAHTSRYGLRIFQSCNHRDGVTRER